METKYYQVCFIYEDYCLQMFSFCTLHYALLMFRESLSFVYRAYVYEITIDESNFVKSEKVCSYEKSASL